MKSKKDRITAIFRFSEEEFNLFSEVICGGNIRFSDKTSDGMKKYLMEYLLKESWKNENK